jgi:hypothetical protein
MLERLRESVLYYFHFLWDHEEDDADMTEMHCADCSCDTKLQYRHGFLFANARIDGVSTSDPEFTSERPFSFFVGESLTADGARAMARGLGLVIVNNDGETL